MKNLYLIATFLFVFLPTVALAGTVGNDLSSFLSNVIGFINRILIPLALAIAFIFFVWGVVKYFVIGGDSDDGKTKGKDIIIYSLVGFVVIFSFYGLVNILTDGLGFGGENSELPGIPVVPVPPSTE